MPRFDRLGREALPPLDAVVVTLWRSAGRTVADVVATSECGAGALQIAEFPRPVPMALQRAEDVRRQCQLARVVVRIGDPSLWQKQWGELVDCDANEVEVTRSTPVQRGGLAYG